MRQSRPILDKKCRAQFSSSALDMNAECGYFISIPCLMDLSCQVGLYGMRAHAVTPCFFRNCAIPARLCFSAVMPGIRGMRGITGIRASRWRNKKFFRICSLEQPVYFRLSAGSINFRSKKIKCKNGKIVFTNASISNMPQVSNPTWMSSWCNWTSRSWRNAIWQQGSPPEIVTPPPVDLKKGLSIRTSAARSGAVHQFPAGSSALRPHASKQASQRVQALWSTLIFLSSRLIASAPAGQTRRQG